ncbi:MAG: DUF2953 domain-containing protein, partial [Syntrophomonadaceae bacterium]|nr:DUF2953 domain-containing protein [Syntrophomonadaceae bacterium]
NSIVINLFLPVFKWELRLWHLERPRADADRPARQKGGEGSFYSSLKPSDFKGLFRVLSHCRLYSLRWESRLGLEDAMYTAIGAGALWAIKGSFLSAMSRRGKLREARLLVLPEYERIVLNSSFSGIFNIRVAHIIITGLKSLRLLIRWWLNGYTKRKRASYREFDANCHAKY